MPNVDRGGGRESKGHERRVKRGLAAKANPFQKKDTGAVAAITESVTPQSLTNERSASSLVDLGCNILSRQLAREQGRMLQRAQNDHVDAVVVFSTDFDRIQELVTLVKAYPGFMYGAYGIHPDNIKRANEKTFTGKMSELKAMALSPECVALFCGLDFGRDFASHYPQQKIVQDHLRLAAEIRLPVLITQVDAAERLGELLREFNDEWAATSAAAARAAAATVKGPDAPVTAGAGAREGGSKGKGGKESKEPKEGKEGKEGKEAKEAKVEPAPAPAPVAAPTQAPWLPRAGILAFDGDEKALQSLLDAGAYICIDGLVCDETPEANRLRSIVAKIPLDRLLLMTNSPLRTPQNITDHYVKSSRNEPCNLPFLLPKLCECYNEAGTLSHKITTAELAHITYENSVKFLQFPSNDFAGSGDTSGKKETSAGKATDGAASSSATGAAGSYGRGVSGVSESKGGDVSAKEGEGGEEEELTPQQMAAGVQYRCKLCRFPVFTDSDVMPHDRHGIKKSARSRANDGEEGGEDEEEDLAPGAKPKKPKAADDDVGSSGDDSSDVSDDDLRTFAGGKTGKRGPKTIRYFGETGTVMEIDDSGDVAASRWHTSKGRLVKHTSDGGCRMLLIDRQVWMDYAPTEPEGSILCPGCNNKIGLYNLGGLKCSCGLRVAPAYKIPKNRVDAALQGIDILEAAMAGMDLHSRGIIEEEEEEEEEEEDSEEEEEEDKAVKGSKKMKVPVGTHKGNFSQFRNKVT